MPTLTGKITDLGIDNLDARGVVEATVETQVDGYVGADNALHLDKLQATTSGGVLTITDLPDTSQIENLRLRLHLNYIAVGPGGSKKRSTFTSGWFEATADLTLADVVDSSIPNAPAITSVAGAVTEATTAATTATTAKADALAAQAAAEAARDEAASITAPLTAPANEQVASYIANPGAAQTELDARMASSFGAVVKPSKYGAAGDGSTDDTAAFQAAIDALAVGSVLDGEGKTYLVGALTWNKSYFAAKDIRFKTVPGTIDMASPVTIGAYSDTTLREWIFFKNVHIDGQRAQQDGIGSAEDGGRHGFRLIGRVEHLRMEDCSATMCASDGLAVYSGTGMTAFQSYATGIKSDLRFIRCDFTWNRRHGASLDCATDVVFEDCRFNDNGLDVAGDGDGAAGALNGGSRYGNGIDMEEYSLLTYIGDVTLTRCEALRNAHPGVLVFEPSGSLANDPNWTTRSGFHFNQCHIDSGVGDATTGYALDITPAAANKTTGTYFTDISITDCLIDGLVGLRSVGSVRHIGGSVRPASGNYVGNADQVADLLVSGVARGVRRYSVDNATIRYAASEPEAIWLGPDRFTVIGGTPTQTVYTFNPVWEMSDAEADRLGAIVSIPWDWEKVHIDLFWTHTSNSGNVYWRCDTGAPLTPGAVIGDPPSGSIVIQATGTAGQVNVTRLGTNRAVVPGLVPLELLRSGTDAQDTLVTNAYVLGLKITRAV